MSNINSKRSPTHRISTPTSLRPSSAPQVLWKALLVHRFAGHPLDSFVDLLFLANTSAVILDERHSGFYLHGRNQMHHSGGCGSTVAQLRVALLFSLLSSIYSPCKWLAHWLKHAHTRADTTLAELNSSLVREEEGLVACRGLVATYTGSVSAAGGGLLASGPTAAALNDNQVSSGVWDGSVACCVMLCARWLQAALRPWCWLMSIKQCCTRRLAALLMCRCAVLFLLQVFLLHVSPELRRSYQSMLLSQIEQVRSFDHSCDCVLKRYFRLLRLLARQSAADHCGGIATMLPLPAALTQRLLPYVCLRL